MEPVGRRMNFIIQMIGANHTGKTSLTKRIVKDWRDARPEIILDRSDKAYGTRKYKVIAFDQKNQFGRDLVDSYIYPDRFWARDLMDKEVKNTLIILDDYKMLIPDYKATPGMFDLFYSRWHYNLDFIISCHSPNQLLETITDYITEYYIFHTKSNDAKFEAKLQNSKKLLDMAKTVNKYVGKYGLGKHPLDPDFMKPPNNGQRFPYMVFDTTKPDANARGYNMRADFKL